MFNYFSINIIIVYRVTYCTFQIRAREAWDHILSLFMVLAGPLPVDRLQSLVTLLSTQPQQPAPSSVLILSLFLSAAAFFQQSLNRSTEILQTVRQLFSPQKSVFSYFK